MDVMISSRTSQRKPSLSTRRVGWTLALLLALAAAPARGEEAEATAVATPAAPGADKVRDNLFLLEEAYNQEPGVIQHIQVFQLDPRSNGWSYTFTEEWPVPTDLHQLSVTVPLANPGQGGSTALGDLMLNYRLQAAGLGGVGVLALAPRLSLVLPTGDYKEGQGRGAIGVQLNLPASLDLGSLFTLHLNAGLTVTPATRTPGGHAETALDGNAGAALVFLPWHWGNALVEVAWQSLETPRDGGSSLRQSLLFVNPGLRFAIDTPGGLQIVPGVSAPVRFVDGQVDVLALGYLSFEHSAF
jgi:hypothetical protein